MTRPSVRASVDPAAVPRAVREVCAALQADGHGAWVVGGCVRDHLLGRAVSDWDLCTSATPRRVMKLFRRTVPTGIEHGTVTVFHDGEQCEVTTLRGDGAYTDGRRPDTVAFIADLGEDLARRDFTVNAIAYDPIAETLSDPHGGLGDLRLGLLRAVGDPRTRFREDGLRVLRGARFTAALGFDLEAATEAAIPEALDVFGKVSAERVREEWIKALKAHAPSRAFRVMARTGSLAVTLPALDRVASDAEAWERAMAALDTCPLPFTSRLGALLHGVDVKVLDGWFRAGKFSNDERATVLRLVRFHDVTAVEGASDASLRRWLRDVGREAVGDVLDVAGAVRGVGLAELRARVRAELDGGVPLAVNELAVDGNMLMAKLGMKPSRALGATLAGLLEDVLDDPSRNTPDALLDRARARIDAGASG